MPISDQDAQLLADNFDALAPEQQAKAKVKLQEWHDERATVYRAAADARERTIYGMFSDPVTLGLPKSDLDALNSKLVNSNNPQGDKHALANASFLSHVTGIPYDDVVARYPIIRDDYAAVNYDAPKGLDDAGFYTATSHRINAATDTVNNASNAAMMGVSLIDGLDIWKKATVGHPGFRSEMSAQWQQAHKEISDRITPYNDTINGSLADLQSIYGVQKDGKPLADTVDQSSHYAATMDVAAKLLAVPERDRGLVIKAMITRAEAAGADAKGFIKQFGESISRGAEGVGYGTTNAYLRGVTSVLPDMLGQSDNPTALDTRDKALQLLELQKQVRDIGEGSVDPVKPIVSSTIGLKGRLEAASDFMESSAYGAARMSPMVAASINPASAWSVVMPSFAEDGYNQLRQSNPEMSRERAMDIAAVAAPLEQALYSMHVGGLLGRLPALQRFAQADVGASFGSIATRYLARTAADVGAGAVAMKGAELVRPTLQWLASGVSQDVPGVDWWKEFDQWTDGGRNLEMIGTLLPYALWGAKGVTARDIARTQAAQGREKIGRALGIPAASAKLAADAIRAGDFAAADKAWSESFASRGPADVEAIKDLAKDGDLGAKALMLDMQRAGVTIEKTGDQWAVRTKEGGESKFDTHDEAFAAFKAHADALDIKADDNLMKTFQVFSEGAKDGEAHTLSGRDSSLLDYWDEASKAGDQRTLDDIWERANIERERSGLERLPRGMVLDDAALDLGQFSVLGQSVVELRENVAGTAGRVYRSIVNRQGTAIDHVEEKAEGDVKRWFDSGRITPAAMAELIRNVEVATGDTYLHGDSKTAVIEAYSQLARLYVTGTKGGTVSGAARSDMAQQARAARLKDRQQRERINKAAGDEQAKPIIDKLKQYTQYFREVFKRVGALMKAQKEGKLGDVEKYLMESVGLSENHAHAKVVQEFASKLAENGLELDAGNSAFSLKRVTPEQDAAYMKAVDSGDMETAQKMVDEVARETGYNVGPVFHGTSNSFDVFDSDGIGHHFGTETAANERLKALNVDELPVEVVPDRDGTWDVYHDNEHVGNYSTEAEAKTVAGQLPTQRKPKRFFLQLANPIRMPDLGQWHFEMLAKDLRDKKLLTSSQYEKAWKTNDPARALADLLKKKGFDGIYYRNEVEDKNSVSFIAFDPSQIKSADPVTRDSEGNVIPLSERFNAASDSISFSIAPSDRINAIAEALGKESREPERRRNLLQRAKDLFNERSADWLPLIENKRMLSNISKERNFREATSFAEHESKLMGERMSPDMQAALDSADLAKLKNHPLVEAILGNVGKLMSRTEALKSGKLVSDGLKAGDYDGAPRLPSWMYGGSKMPDQVAQELHDMGMLKDAYPDTLWSELGKAVESTSQMADRVHEANTVLRGIQKDAREAAVADAEKWQGDAIKKATSKGADRERLVASMRTLDAVLAALPSELRSKVGGFIQLARLSTDAARIEEIQRRVEKIGPMLEGYFKKVLTDDTEKLFDRFAAKGKSGEKPKGKIGAEAQSLMDAAKKAMDYSGDARDAELARLDKLIAGGTLTPEQEALARREAEVVSLFGDWKNADAAQMQAAYDAIESTVKGGYLDWKARLIAKAEARAEARVSLKDDTGTTGAKTERQEQEERAKTLLGKARNMALSLSSFHEVVSYVFGRDSKQGIHLVDSERKAAYQYEDAIQAMSDSVSKLFTKLAGGELAGEKLRFDMSQKSIDAKTEKLSQLEAIQALLMWNQADGRRHMEGPRDENGKPLPDKWAYDQAWVDNVASQLTPEAREVMRFIQQTYAGEWATLNPYYRERHGVNLPHHDNYAPLTVKPQQASGAETTDPITGMPSTGSILTPGSLRTRNRTATAEPEFRDALQTLIGHTKQMEYWKAYYDFAVDAQAILGNRELGNAIEAKAGKSGVTILRKWVDAFAQGGFKDASAGLDYTKALQRVVGRASTAALFGRVSTLLVQSTQLAAASVEMPVADYLSRFSKLMTGQLGWGDAMKSDFIQRRLITMPPLVRQAMESLAAAKRPNEIKHLAGKVGELLNGADALFTAGTYAMLLDYHRANAVELGMKGAEAEAWAKTEAERATERVAQPTRMGQRSLMEITSTNPLSRAMWAFASESRQKLSMMAWAAANAGKNPAYAAKVAFLTFVVGGLLPQVIKNLWREVKGDDDQRKWAPQRLIVSMLSQVYSAAPGGSMLVDSFLDPRANSGLLSGGSGVSSALKHLPDDLSSGDAVHVMQDVESIFTAAALFNDTAAGVSSLSHAGVDGAKLLQHLFTGESTNRKK